MQRMVLDQDIQPLSDFRAGAATYIKQVHHTKRPLVITQRGRGVAVLLDIAVYEHIQAKLELLEDIDTAETQIEQGQYYSHQDAQAIILKKIKDGN
jgi:antitoxin YefM